ncbi:MAG: hypothetical protein QOF20_3272 [Acidimicrobiaceae bacterium]|nr:hypothetical protein [Acidimicrobiaceae bacterium]
MRAEIDGGDRRFLDAFFDDDGDLRIDGQDLGPATAIVSGDGEYEWGRTIAAADVPRLLEELGGQQGEDVLDLLQRNWSGARSYDLEKLLRETTIPVSLWTWSG